MKILSLTILSITLSLSLWARENPFEPTDHFLEQKEIILEANKQAEITQAQEEEIKLRAITDKMMAQNHEKEKPKEIELAKEKEIKKKVQKLFEEKKAVVEIEKEYIPDIKQNFKILPFIKIYVINDVITINVDAKYKLLNQDILKPEKKLLFDFKGEESFYTIRKKILSEDFISLTVGTHMKEKFFRVVIDLPEDIINYIEKVDSKKGIITIQKK